MKTETIDITKIKSNPNNPRVIKDEKFKKLVQSIKEFPKMLSIRPIVVNEEMIVLGGNMRLKACIEAGLKNVPVIKITNMTIEEQNEFIIKDNVGFGEWNWDNLANEWDSQTLSDWGLDVWVNNDIELNDFFEENNDEEKKEKFQIVLDYSEEDYNKVLDAFGHHSGSKEAILFKLLGL
ncbi:ParB/Sulfiredoxin [uncultured Caudovirales phage]|uniref:ParB/Sulfiredoxin n=1 Tax=uncultured Caudovirales phage TaxID=2100421 RepID=A0A6J5N8W7_9CAUD|nr:ParB/Sulfiredoxin [uncultured Caudovirales phage]